MWNNVFRRYIAEYHGSGAVSIKCAKFTPKTWEGKGYHGIMSWGHASNISNNLKHTFDSSDPIFHALSIHAPMLTEVRYVRNHIAHSNDLTRDNFRKVVRSYYGGLRRGITPGVLLLTEAFGTPIPLQKYIRYLRVFIKDVVRA